MDSPISLDNFGDKEIPDFILKLYTILDKAEFEDIIGWAGNFTEVHIKDQKKMEEIILPTYFRHKKIESFIRQLNMYRFGKVNKISKEKKHMFFKNDLFKKGNLKHLHLIRRKRKGQQEPEATDSDRGFEDYKLFVRENILKIQEDLTLLRKKHPQVSSELTSIISFTGALAGQSDTLESSSQTQSDQQSLVKQEVSRPNLFQSNKNFLCFNMRSLKHFDSKCSIDLVFNDNFLI